MRSTRRPTWPDQPNRVAVRKVNDRRSLLSDRSAFKLSMLDGCFRLKSAITKLIDVVEAVKNLVVVGDSDDRRVLLDGDLAKQVNDDPGAMQNRMPRSARRPG